VNEWTNQQKIKGRKRKIMTCPFQTGNVLKGSQWLKRRAEAIMHEDV
jgi:ribosome modulation factor